jgi:acetyl/propionyl-CoA carboxylase alpha subunit
MNLPIYTIESPFEGTIEKIYIKEQAYTYEWEKLFLLKTVDGKTVDIMIGASGTIKSVQVRVGERVKCKSLLASLQDDNVISGCD